jgi:hypothetical protein
MGRRIRAPSTLNTRPAPREIHTENVNVFRPANLASDACKYLDARLVLCECVELDSYLPSDDKQSHMQPPKQKIKDQLGRRKVRLPIHVEMPEMDRVSY